MISFSWRAVGGFCTSSSSSSSWMVMWLSCVTVQNWCRAYWYLWFLSPAQTAKTTLPLHCSQTWRVNKYLRERSVEWQQTCHLEVTLTEMNTVTGEMSKVKFRFLWLSGYLHLSGCHEHDSKRMLMLLPVEMSHCLHRYHIRSVFGPKLCKLLCKLI